MPLILLPSLSSLRNPSLVRAPAFSLFPSRSTESFNWWSIPDPAFPTEELYLVTISNQPEPLLLKELLNLGKNCIPSSNVGFICHMGLSEIKREAAHALEKSGFPLEKSHDCRYSWVGDITSSVNGSLGSRWLPRDWLSSTQSETRAEFEHLPGQTSSQLHNV